MATNLKDYTNLRTLLDSLEDGALRFYLSGKGMSQPKKFKYLKDTLVPIIHEVWQQSQGVNKLGVDSECPPGYNECNGVCVPYPCPDGGLATLSSRAQSAKRKR
jgi:hypothetical protein